MASTFGNNRTLQVLPGSAGVQADFSYNFPPGGGVVLQMEMGGETCRFWFRNQKRPVFRGLESAEHFLATSIWLELYALVGYVLFFSQFEQHPRGWRTAPSYFRSDPDLVKISPRCCRWTHVRSQFRRNK